MEGGGDDLSDLMVCRKDETKTKRKEVDRSNLVATSIDRPVRLHLIKGRTIGSAYILPKLLVKSEDRSWPLHLYAK